MILVDLELRKAILEILYIGKRERSLETICMEGEVNVLA